VVKFVFSHSKSRKQPFIPKNFKSRGAKATPFPPPSDAHASDVKSAAFNKCGLTNQRVLLLHFQVTECMKLLPVTGRTTCDNANA